MKRTRRWWAWLLYSVAIATLVGAGLVYSASLPSATPSGGLVSIALAQGDVAHELVDQRTRTSKTTYLGETPDGQCRFAVNASIGSIHYQENPKDSNCPWLVIDTTITPDGRVTTAPYDLWVYLNGVPGFYYQSKDSGAFTVRLREARADNLSVAPVLPDSKVKPVIQGNTVTWMNLYPDTDVILTAGNDGVSLQRLLKSPSAPQEYDVDVTVNQMGKASLRPLQSAIDADGLEIPMTEKAIVGGRTETLVLPKMVKWPVLDATTVDESVGASADDDLVIRHYAAGTYWANTAATIRVGNFNATYYGYGGAMRFTGISIPAGADLTTSPNSYLTVVSFSSLSATTVRTDLCCENSSNPGQIANYADHIGRTRTTGAACVAWDGIAAWTAGTSYQSVDISAAIQKVVDDQSGTGDALIVFWEDKDYESDTGAYRELGSYDQVTYAVPAIHIEYTAGGVCAEDIANAPSSIAFGVVHTSSTYWSNGSEPTWPLTDGDAYFTITNSSGGAVTVQAKATNFTGGIGWTLAGTPAGDTVTMSVFEEGDGSGDGLTLTTSYQSFIIGLANNATVDWELKLQTATSHSDGAAKTSTLTLNAVCE